MRIHRWSLALGILVGFLLGAGATYAAIQYSYEVEVPALVIVGTINPPLEIVTNELPDAEVGEEYHAALEASGGATPYAWNVTGLPNGLTCSDDGVISGTPIGQVGQFTMTATVTDDLGDTDGRELSLTTVCRMGDANLDGVVDAGDITKVKRIFFEMDDPTPCGDVNGDGLVNAGDVTAIKIVIFGLM